MEGSTLIGWKGFLQGVSPGLRPDCKKSHCFSVNSGTSSYTSRSAEQAQLPKITEKKTGSGTWGWVLHAHYPSTS